MKYGITLKDESLGTIITGLTVKLVTPGDNWSSGDNITLTEVGSSGYYQNDSIASNEEGYYEIWTDNGGPGADSGLRAIVGQANQAGLSFIGDGADEVPQNADALDPSELVATDSNGDLETTGIDPATVLTDDDVGNAANEIPQNASTLDPSELIATDSAGDLETTGIDPATVLTDDDKGSDAGDVAEVAPGGISGDGIAKWSSGKLTDEAEGTAFNQDFGEDAGDVPAIASTLVNGQVIYGYLDGGIVKLKSSGVVLTDLLDAVKVDGHEGAYMQLSSITASGESVIGDNKFNIDLDLPAGVKVAAVQFRVDVALDRTWKASFTGGLTFEIGNTYGYTLNTKANELMDENANALITSTITDVAIESDAATNFAVEGTVHCTVYYWELEPMGDFGA